MKPSILHMHMHLLFINLIKRKNWFLCICTELNRLIRRSFFSFDVLGHQYRRRSRRRRRRRIKWWIVQVIEERRTKNKRGRSKAYENTRSTTKYKRYHIFEILHVRDFAHSRFFFRDFFCRDFEFRDFFLSRLFFSKLFFSRFCLSIFSLSRFCHWIHHLHHLVNQI